MSTHGYDISAYQRGISFDILKNSARFLILRGGYTTNGGRRKRCIDQYFNTFYNEAKKYNIPVGVYYYSCAQNYQEGKEDAVYLYNNVLKGRKFEYPIYIDVEDQWMLKAGKTGCTNAVHGFCQYLESKGYYTGFYAGYYVLYNQMFPEPLQRYTWWCPWWNTSHTPPKKISTIPNMHIWQHCGGGCKVGGYAIDGDYSYVDFPKIIKKAGLNGYEKESI